MEPLTALGVASNVLQVVDFATKLIRDSRAIYKSGSSASEDTIVLDTVARDFYRLSDAIVAPERCSDALRQLTNETKRITGELLSALEKLKVGGRKTKWKSFVVAIRGVLSKEEVESLADRLGRLQAQLNTHMQILISDGISKISLTMEDLQKLSIRFDLRQASYLRTLHEELVQSVERLIQTRVEDVYHIARDVDLSRLTELPTTISKFHDDLGAVEAQVSKTMRDWQLLQTLHFDSIWARHDKIVKAHSDTFTWIFKSVLPNTNEKIRYVEWLRERDGIFWIHGKPGSGKSTLMKFLVNHRDTLDHLQAWARGRSLVMAKFYFWNSGTKLQKSQEGLLRSLLFEILHQSPALLPGVYGAVIGPQTMVAPEFGVSQYSSEIHWSLQNLLRSFEYLRGQDISANFCFFIDGLDEYKDEKHHDHGDLIKVLHTLATSPHIKLCLSSRPWTVFKDAFGNDPDMTIRLEDLTRNDIRRYVLDSFNGHKQFPSLRLRDPGYAQLVEEVVRKAQGVFLWVFLVVRDLLEGLTYNDDIKTMRRRLDRFPEDLDAFFRHILDSISKVYRIQTARAFQIALSREEPLPLLTYCLVDDVEEDPNLRYVTCPELSQEQILDQLAVMRRQIEGRSKGLLEVAVTRSKDITNVNVVEFLHRTVRDFLLNTPDVRQEMMGNLETKAETWVLLCRATSLMIKHSLRVRGAYMDYMRHLFYFARLAVTDSSSEATVHQFLTDTFSKGRNTPDITGIDICLAGEYGLVSYVKEQLAPRLQRIEELAPSDPAGKDKLLGTALRYALLGEDSYGKLSLELVEYLVSLGASPNYVCIRTNTQRTVFVQFLNKLGPDKLSPNEPEVLEIVRILLAHETDSDSETRKIIRKRFPREQVAWLFSGVTRAKMQERYDDEARKLRVEQEPPQGSPSPLIQTLGSTSSPLGNKPWQNPPEHSRSEATPGRGMLQAKHIITRGADDPTRLSTDGPHRIGTQYGPPRVFQQRPAPVQCFHCQRFGHKANQCKSDRVCARCAMTGHHHKICHAKYAKCALCGGPHESFNRSCS